MTEKIVTLYIDDNCLRLMVAQGKRIREWAETPLEPGLVENSVVIKEAEVAAKIRQLFNAQKVGTSKIAVGVSGLHCLTRPITLPRLPKDMLNEAVTREVKRALPVPLEQLYISWQTIPAPEGKTQVFLVAIPIKMADALLKTLQKAGLKPSFMGIKPLLIAGVAKEPTAVVVDVQKTEFDIVIMADGVPQPIRTISFPNEEPSWQERLATIKNELDRTISFYNSNNPEKPLASSVPIFASGDLATEPELRQTLSDEVGHPVLLVSLPLDCPDGFAPSHYMVNIGLTMQKLSHGNQVGASVVCFNALPTPYLPKPISLTNVLALPGAAIGAGLLAVLLVLIQSTSADITSLRAQVNTADHLLQLKLAQRQELLGKVSGLEKEIAEIESSRDNFTAALGSLEGQSAAINHDLEVTITRLPSTISLSSIGHASGILAISGRAPSEKNVLQYLMELDASGRFGEISISNMTRAGDGGMDFTLIGSLQTHGEEVSSLEIALKNLPTTMSVTSFSSADGTLTIDGKSPDEGEVLAYLQVLEASGKFDEITVSSMTAAEGGGMNFSLVLVTGE
ncbi:PilN domain-containing protein [Chloroflexota bacterium]